MSEDLLARAREGDGEAFGRLAEPYRRELQVHCYRILGSLADAEDLLQETLQSAWQGLAGFEGRASLRSWLYRIATNRCLNWLRSARRRPAAEWPVLEACLRMPPVPLEYPGPGSISRFLATVVFREGRRYRLLCPGAR